MLSIIIVNWRVRELLRKCLESVRREMNGVSCEVIVIDNASGDGSAEIVAADFPWVKLVASDRNLGFAAANNLGLKQATGDLVLLLNPDTELEAGALAKLVDFMRRHPFVGVCGPRLLNSDGTHQPSVRRFPKFVDQALVALKLHRLWPNAKALRRYRADDFDYARPQPCDQVMGAALLIRRSVIEAIGPLDAGFFIWFEEVDWCRRAVAAGFQVWYMPEAEITHHGGESFAQILGFRRQRWFNGSMLRYFRKHESAAAWLGLLFLQPMSLLAAWSVDLLRRKTGGEVSAEAEAARVPVPRLNQAREAFWWALAGFALLEIISFWGYAVPPVNAVGFGLAALLIVGLAVWRFEWALLLLIAELLVGSQGGYLLYFGETSGLQFSLRMLLWLVVLSVWAARSLVAWRRGGIGLEWLVIMRQRRLLWPYLILLAVFSWAGINGIARGNGIANVFFDANGYAYFALLPAFLQGLGASRSWSRLIGLGLAGVTVATLKALLVLFVFSHRLLDIAAPTYTWVRDARVGEITRMVGDYYRVFFQSQLFGLVALLLAVPVFLGRSGWWRDRVAVWCGYGVTVAAAALLLSLSRSFWFGLFVAGFVLLGWLVWTKAARRVWGRLVVLAVVSIMLGSALIWVSYALPWPQKGASVSFASLIGGRATSLTGEAAANSRWALLPILNSAALEHPLLGSGFGRTVTYVTSDPRLLADIPTGEYVTFAFEWGYHDLWLKFGLLGLAIYGWFVWRVARPWLALAHRRDVWRLSDEERQATLVAVGITLTLVALLATNVFSPYLNHPLGIGLLMMIAAAGRGRE